MHPSPSKFLSLFISIVVISSYLILVSSHGRVMDPVHRGARWRFNNSAPPNYNDHELFCGGFGVQWKQNGGQCGLCGDDFRMGMPRPHELGGKYGEGVVVRRYGQGEDIEVVVYISANHMGYFYFELCNLDASQEVDECFEENLVQTSSGADYWKVPSGSAINFKVPLRLPDRISCKHCVLRWTYVAGKTSLFSAKSSKSFKVFISLL